MEGAMDLQDPLDKPRDVFDDLIERLSSPDSPVGIDAKYTHAVIIDYLRQLSARMAALERAIGKQ